jgi:hypothetical protein
VVDLFCISQSGNGVQQLHPVPECSDAKLL